MNDRRGFKCGAGVRRTQRGPLGDERHDDELQSNQGTRRRSDDDVKAVPSRELWTPFPLVGELTDQQRKRLGVTGDP